MNPIKSMRLSKLVFPLFSALFVVLISGCSSQSSQTYMEELDLAPLSRMPQYIQEAPVSVQQAYQFAVANPDMLKQIPCYCGCNEVGHTSNYDCYVKGQNPDGSPSFEAHALGCSICVDITQDSMRLLGKSKSVTEIRSYIDATYAQYGPSNLP